MSDSARETLLLVQKCAHTFSFYDLATGQAEKHIVLPNFPHEFTVDPKRRRAYVGHYGIETASHLGDVGGHSVFVIDLDSREHVATLNIWPFYRPHGLTVDSEGRLFVASGKTRRDPNRVYRFRGAQGQDLLLTTNSGEHSLSIFGTDLQELRCFALPSNPLALSFHPSDRAVYISFQDETVRRLNLDSFEFEQEIKTLREPDSSYVWQH